MDTGGSSAVRVARSSLRCLSDVHEELRQLCAALLRQPPLSRFPKLQARLREEVDTLLDRERAQTQAKLEEIISMEEAYIYTDVSTCHAHATRHTPHAQSEWGGSSCHDGRTAYAQDTDVRGVDGHNVRVPGWPHPQHLTGAPAAPTVRRRRQGLRVAV